MTRKRTFYLWAIVGPGNSIAVDGHNGKTPYLWGDRREASMNADCISGFADDLVQRVKVTIEPAGPPHEVKEWP